MAKASDPAEAGFSRLGEAGPYAKQHGLKPVPNRCAGSESRGRYPVAFDYKCCCVPPTETNRALCLWVMLFCETLITFVLFRDPACPCAKSRIRVLQRGEG